MTSGGVDSHFLNYFILSKGKDTQLLPKGANLLINTQTTKFYDIMPRKFDFVEFGYGQERA